MAPPAKSRKGKKAWRKNIDASEVEAFLEEETYQQRRGPAAKELKDDQLFFVDTTADIDGAAAVADGKRPAKRRREEAAAKPLRSQQIIAEAHKAKPLTMAPTTRKPTAPPAATANGTKRRTRGPGSGAGSSHPLDLWGDEDLGMMVAEPGPGSASLAKEQQQQQLEEGGRKVKKAKKASAAEGVKAGAGAAAVRVMGPSAKALRRSPPPVRIKAVAVDVPGCSFNPDVEQHQDALALLVASEMRRELRKELLPTAPPLEVDAPQGRPLTELEALQEEAAYSDGEEENGAAEVVADPNAIALTGEDGDGDDDDGEGGEGDGKGAKGGRKKAEKKVRKDRNKEARRKAADVEAGERRRLKAQRRTLQSLPGVEAQLEEEEADKEIRRMRRTTMREERSVVEPPRLGKLRFEPPSVQVMTTDQTTGSLRQVMPCAMLAADRFKSLQQRGLLEPRKPQPFKEKRRQVAYEKGARFEKSAEASTEVRDLTFRNKKARRKAKTAAAAGGAGGDDDWL